MQTKLVHHETALRSLLSGGAHAEFCTVFARADNQSREVLDLINDDVEIHSFSQADYSLNCWDSTWQDALTELTAIRPALQRKDTAGTLLREHLLACLAKLNYVHEIVQLAGKEWASLMQLDPKRMSMPRPIAMKQEKQEAYDNLLKAVNTLLEEPVEVL